MKKFRIIMNINCRDRITNTRVDFTEGEEYSLIREVDYDVNIKKKDSEGELMVPGYIGKMQ